MIPKEENGGTIHDMYSTRKCDIGVKSTNI